MWRERCVPPHVPRRSGKPRQALTTAMKPLDRLLVMLGIGILGIADAAAQSPVVPVGPAPFARGNAVPPTILFKPEVGTGPWSVVVLLPTCAGVNIVTFDWAERL